MRRYEARPRQLVPSRRMPRSAALGQAVARNRWASRLKAD